MKVKFTQNAQVQGKPYKRGSTADLPDHVAEPYIRTQQAVRHDAASDPDDGDSVDLRKAKKAELVEHLAGGDEAEAKELSKLTRAELPD